MTDNKRLLNIKNGYNFRDIGGYPTSDGRTTKWHKIIRSGNLAELDSNDQAYLKNYGVTNDIDLRSKMERDSEPDLLPDGIKYSKNPIFEQKQRRTADVMKKLYSTDPTVGKLHMQHVYEDLIENPIARDSYRRLFQILLKDPGESSLIHCSQGKDRTGMGIVMLMFVLGVDEKDIQADYLESAKQMVPYVQKKVKEYERYNINNICKENIKSLYTVSIDYYNAAMDKIKELYGNMNNFIHEYLQLSDSDIQKLRDKYLTNS
ncbi:tyrosine-protein phosphatase [Nicoliella spurrieriana]|uniref:Tyrosine-protein phosphatase n=1 Tax=Nicoliella spurrieriana TaxID=2925830 RepID=A0A976X5P5_9LACO|nr:tyrosine-protein phosphatase [Nicoliella spurrieriana]UQS87120.1 tyrosine-protein phosphatase [Nicoliella spurrieriana]